MNLQILADDEIEQAEAVWSGVHITDRDDGEHKILLYPLIKERFYVEAYYHKEFSVLRKFRAYKTTELLDLYADQTDVVKLWNI